MTHAPLARTAVATVVHEGYVRQDDDGQHVGSTVGLVRDGDLVLVVDPGLVADRERAAGRAAGRSAPSPRT